MTPSYQRALEELETVLPKTDAARILATAATAIGVDAETLTPIELARLVEGPLRTLLSEDLQPQRAKDVLGRLTHLANVLHLIGGT